MLEQTSELNNLTQQIPVPAKAIPSLSGKRVLYILPQPFFMTRGSSFRALATIKGLASQGVTVDVVAFPLGEEINIPGVSLFRSFRVPGIRHVPIGPSVRKILFDSLLLLRCTIQVLKSRYDVIHGVEEGGIIAAILGKIFKVPYIFDMHSWMSVQLEDAGFTHPKSLLKIFRYIETICIRHASVLITVGSALTYKASKIAPKVPGFTLEDHALDVSPVSPFEKEDLRRELKIGERPVVLYTGNFESYQGIDLLIEGYAHFINQTRSIKTDKSLPVLLLVGGGDQNSSLVVNYKKRIDELGIQDSVVFVGQRGWNEMGLFMDISQVLVSPRVNGENTPLKVYSYMAAGKIIVATKISSHTQVLNDENSILADPSPASLAKALTEALDTSPEVIGKHAEKLARAKEAAESRFTERSFFRQIAACYKVIFDPLLSCALILSSQFI